MRPRATESEQRTKVACSDFLLTCSLVDTVGGRIGYKTQDLKLDARSYAILCNTQPIANPAG